MVVSDLAWLLMAVVIGLVSLSYISTAKSNSLGRLGHNLATDLIVPFACVAAFATYGLYRGRHRRVSPNSFGELKDIVHALAAGGFLAIAASAVLHPLIGTSEVHAAQLAAICITAVVTVSIGRATTRTVITSRSPSHLRVLIIGSGMMASRVSKYLGNERGIEVVGLVDDNPFPRGDIKTLGSMSDLRRLCKEHQVDRVLVGFSQTHPKEMVQALRDVQGQDGIPISIVPRYYELLSWRSQVDEIRGLPVIDVAPQYLSLSARMAKRTFDIAISAFGLLAAMPVIIVAAALIKITSPGPVFFTQDRVGRHRRTFRIIKLRTMTTEAEAELANVRRLNEADGPMFKVKRDPRITSVGNFLRKTSLDELPQLFNVLIGHMSLVGPRPFIGSEADEIGGWAARRFETSPGITGLWQVSGRSDLSFDELCQLDYLYVASWSLWWDIKILWQTPSRVLRREGAY